MYDLVKHQYVVLIVSDSTELVMTEKFFHCFYSLIFTNVGDKNNALQGTCTLYCARGFIKGWTSGKLNCCEDILGLLV